MYDSMYTLLFNRITDVTESLKTALENGDELSRDRTMLRAVAELTRAQSGAEEMYISQSFSYDNFCDIIAYER